MAGNRRGGRCGVPAADEPRPKSVSPVSVRGWLELAFPLVKASEGLRLESYPDPATGGEPYTIGYGATGPGIGPDTAWTRGQAEDWLVNRLKDDMSLIVRSVNVPLESKHKAALASFVYNVGIGAFRDSTLLELLNQGQFEDAADEFPHWKYAAGEVLPGLITRRARERSLFLTGTWGEV